MAELLFFLALAAALVAVAVGLAALKSYLRRHDKSHDAVVSGMAAYQQTFHPNAMAAREETQAQRHRDSSVTQADERSGGQSF